MARWEPGAQERLQRAAMELFVERGYAGTTVEDIAARAGLTERTFFRYFSDKREVLFGATKDLETILVNAIAAAPASTRPLDVVAHAFEAAAPLFAQRRAYARKRQALIGGHAELRERELIKLASLAAIISASLQRRGVADPAVSLIAEMGIAMFKRAFERWLEDTGQHDLSHHIGAALVELRAVSAGPSRSPVRSRTTTTSRRPRPAKRRTSP